MFAERLDRFCKFLAERSIQGGHLILGLRAQLLQVRINSPVDISSVWVSILCISEWES